MRVRITRPRRGEIDGVMLDAFQVGEVYDLPAALATYLVITASAVPADVSGSRFLPFETHIVVSPPPNSPPRVRAVAADRAVRRKKTRRKKR